MAEQDEEKTQETQDSDIDISVENSSEEQKEAVNDTIRKQRLTMSLSIEKISKDLRISKTYVQAIENGDYSAIPAEPYIRVYVKTIAEYLSLDADELLKKLSHERNNQRDTDLNIPVKSMAEVINETKAIKISQDDRNKKFAITGGLIILLLIMAYFLANGRQRNIVQSRTDDFAETIIHDEQDLDDSMANFLPDSLLRGDTILDGKESMPPIEMQLRVLRDSSWVQIAADGVFQRDKIIRGPSKFVEVSAFDSINIHVGAWRVVEININGKPIDKTGATGVWKFTKDSVKVMSKNDWDRIRRVSP